MFASERALVDTFIATLQHPDCPWGPVDGIKREFDYARGRTDVIVVAGGAVLAFEAKLANWREALHQAYRNTCFATNSYVVLPKDVALAAYCYSAEFEERGIGLCYVDGDALVVLQESPSTLPLEPWLACEAISQVNQ